MAINIVTGVPGAGKTFYGVHHLRKNYCVKTGNGFVLKDGFTLITNIDSLLLPHLSLDKVLEKSGKTFEQFFTVPYQESISKKYPKLIYFIDESQRFFSRKTPKDTFYYFQYHRHLGHTVYLFTQNITLLPKEITTLAEFEVRAIRRSLSIMGEMRYLFYSNREVVDRKVLKKDKSIYNLYCSMTAKESEKIHNPFLKYFVILGVIALILCYVFKTTFLKSNTSADVSRVHAQSASTFSTAPKSSQSLSTKSIDVPIPTSVPYVCSFFVLDNVYFILEPLTKNFFPAKSFPYPISLSRTSSGAISAVATLPLHVYEKIFET